MPVKKQPQEPPAPRFEDQRVTLIHHAMVDLVMTHKPVAFGLLPLLNLIVLGIQKPVLLVVFKAPIRRGMPQGASWVQSMRYPKTLGDRFDQEIAAWLEGKLFEEELENRWLLRVSDSPRQSDPALGPDRIFGLGVFYLEIVYSEAALDGTGSHLDASKTRIRPLLPADFELAQSLFASIASYSVIDNEGRTKHPNLRHIARYWAQTRSDPALFARPESSRAAMDQLKTGQLLPMLKPVLDEFDAIYRDLRGGTPGVFEGFSTRSEAGAPLLWSRHRESKSERKGIRPLTLGFYLQLRAPSHPDLPDAAGSYRIVPVVTESMAKDQAAVLLDTEGEEKQKKRKWSNAELLQYLRDLGADNPTENDIQDIESLSMALLKLTDIKTFLDSKRAFHTYTYPAFASGLSTFTKAAPSSRCDRFAYGPDFLSEPGGIDTAFVKPTLVAGFPYMAFVTKTRALIGYKDRPSFETFYFNYIFQVGIVRRWISRRIRAAAEKAYLTHIKRAMVDILLRHTAIVIRTGISQGKEVRGYDVEPEDGLISTINAALEYTAKAFPFAIITIKSQRANHTTDSNTFTMLGRYYEIILRANAYYHRKLIRDDEQFIKITKIKEVMESAVVAAEQAWSYSVGRNITYLP